MSLSYKVINSFGVTGLLSDTTDLSKDTSLKYAVVPSWLNSLLVLLNQVLRNACISDLVITKFCQ